MTYILAELGAHHELWSILMLVQWLTHYDVHGSEIK